MFHPKAKGSAGRMTLCNSTLPGIRRLLHKAIMQRRGPFSTLTCRSCRSSCGEKSSRGVVDSWTGPRNWCAGGAGGRCAPAGDRRRHLNRAGDTPPSKCIVPTRPLSVDQPCADERETNSADDQPDRLEIRSRPASELLRALETISEDGRTSWFSLRFGVS